MTQITTVGVDLAKNVIQICISIDSKVHENKELTTSQFENWLSTSKASVIVFEACGTANYWYQRAISHGHQAKVIAAKVVSAVRQNQKTDANDALAIVQASSLPNLRYANVKTRYQQQLQSLMRMRELVIKQRVATVNQLRALLLELNLRAGNGASGLRNTIESALEDAENGLEPFFRQALDTAWRNYLSLAEAESMYKAQLDKAVQDSKECKRLMALEGVGPINAVNLFLHISCPDEAVYSSGKDVAACIGLTPMQHSSGGKTRLGSIKNHPKNSELRSQLVTGAFTYINQIMKSTPRTKKDQWLQELVKRRGKKCSAVALANKTVRTAYAMITQGTVYRRETLMEV